MKKANQLIELCFDYSELTYHKNSTTTVAQQKVQTASEIEYAMQLQMVLNSFLSQGISITE